MSSNPAFQAAADALRNARDKRETIPRISESHGIAGVQDAYAVAAINTKARLSQGRRIVGKKVGLTSLAVQKQLGVDQPDFGVLFDDMEYLSGQDVPMARLIQPKVEAEVAFIMGSDLVGLSPTWSEFLACIAHVLPAIEIVDSVINDWKITLVDTVADNASSALFVLGNQPVALGSLQLADVAMTMTKNGEQVSSGSGAACLGHPLRAAYWLAQTMAAREQGLRAGEVILSGALGPMVPVVAGDLIEVDVGSLGRVSCRMA